MSKNSSGTIQPIAGENKGDLINDPKLLPRLTYKNVSSTFNDIKENIKTLLHTSKTSAKQPKSMHKHSNL